MQIARLSERITFQKNVAVVDKYRNHTNIWTDYFTCHAYACTYQTDREDGDPVIREDQTITFEVRYCSELKDLDSIHFRVLFHGDVYNIQNVDMMNYQHKSIKVRCKLASARNPGEVGTSADGSTGTGTSTGTSGVVTGGEQL